MELNPSLLKYSPSQSDFDLLLKNLKKDIRVTYDEYKTIIRYLNQKKNNYHFTLDLSDFESPSTFQTKIAELR